MICKLTPTSYCMQHRLLALRHITNIDQAGQTSYKRFCLSKKAGLNYMARTVYLTVWREVPFSFHSLRTDVHPSSSMQTWPIKQYGPKQQQQSSIKIGALKYTRRGLGKKLSRIRNIVGNLRSRDGIVQSGSLYLIKNLTIPSVALRSNHFPGFSLAVQNKVTQLQILNGFSP